MSNPLLAEQSNTDRFSVFFFFFYFVLSACWLLVFPFLSFIFFFVNYYTLILQSIKLIKSKSNYLILLHSLEKCVQKLYETVLITSQTRKGTRRKNIFLKASRIIKCSCFFLFNIYIHVDIHTYGYQTKEKDLYRYMSIKFAFN